MRPKAVPVCAQSTSPSWRPPTADRAALLEVVAPVYDELEEDSVTRAFLEQIRAVEEEANAPPESLICPAGRERVGGDADADRRRVARHHHGRGAGRRR